MKITCEGIFTEQSLGKQSRIKSDRYHIRFAAIFGFHLLYLLKSYYIPTNQRGKAATYFVGLVVSSVTRCLSKK